MMTREEFDDLVRRVENSVGRRPAALRRRVLYLAGVGYGGLLAWLAAIVLVSLGFFAMTIFGADPEGRIACGIAGSLVLVAGGYLAIQALLVRVLVIPPTGAYRSLAARLSRVPGAEIVRRSR